MDIFTCSITARLTRDPELRYGSSGIAFLNIDIASNPGRKEDPPVFFRAAILGKVAESLAPYLKKGTRVAIVGDMRTRVYKDRDGNNAKSHEILVTKLVMLSSNSDGGRYQAPPQQRAAVQAPAPAPVNDFVDDIPF